MNHLLLCRNADSDCTHQPRGMTETRKPRARLFREFDSQQFPNRVQAPKRGKLAIGRSLSSAKVELHLSFRGRSASE